MLVSWPSGDDDLVRSSAELARLPLDARLRRIGETVSGPIVFTTSFGLEDQALTHAIVETGLPVSFATLDTGRLFEETLELWAETELRYGIAVAAYLPDGPSLRTLLREHGPVGFRRSVEARQACCGVRKVRPLGRALLGAAAWMTGLRAEQSANRAATPVVTRDAARGLLKISPLADWSRAEVDAYVRTHDVPYNPLHDRGFPSIGCAPCTRAVRVGEPERAGRWWWEAEAKKECGLHDGHPARRVGRQPAIA